MAGYLGEPPLAPEAWFDTGDLGEFDADGFLHLHARRADLIVSGGENVYPAEVERVLESCPGIGAAAVFGLADETWGQVVAAVLVAPQPPDDEALIDFLEARAGVAQAAAADRIRREPATDRSRQGRSHRAVSTGAVTAAPQATLIAGGTGSAHRFLVPSGSLSAVVTISMPPPA